MTSNLSIKKLNIFTSDMKRSEMSRQAKARRKHERSEYNKQIHLYIKSKVINH